MDEQITQGHEVIATLASRFPQLYVAPSEDAQEAHTLATRKGVKPEGANLDHFVTSSGDELREVQTPAGPIQVVLLENRHDFETFLQIIGHKAQPVPIAATVGAITYSGLADWGMVTAAYEAYRATGGTDWASEFARLAQQPDAFRTQLIVLSQGPYSNIPASLTPYADDQWLRVSHEIRLHHECAHVVCRRTMPQDILPVWDEITADVCGLCFATGGYDASLAALFLGVTQQGFAEGRLKEYLSDEQKQNINEVAIQVYDSLCQIQGMATPDDLAHPFDFLLRLKRAPLLDY